MNMQLQRNSKNFNVFIHHDPVHEITEKLYPIFDYLNKVLQKFSTAQPSSSVAKHKLLTDTKKNNKTS